MVLTVTKRANPVEAQRIITELIQKEKKHLDGMPVRPFTMPTVANLKHGMVSTPPNHPVRLPIAIPVECNEMKVRSVLRHRLDVSDLLSVPPSPAKPASSPSPSTSSSQSPTTDDFTAALRALSSASLRTKGGGSNFLTGVPVTWADTYGWVSGSEKHSVRWRKPRHTDSIVQYAETYVRQMGINPFESKVLMRSDYAALRKRECALERQEADLRESAKLNLAVKFSESQKLAPMVARRAESLRATRASELHERQTKLCAKLAEEQEAYLSQIASLAETPEQRNQRIVDRAVALRAEQEEARLRLVAEKEAERLRLGVDELRRIDSEKFQAETASVLVQQMREKQDRRKREKEEDELMGRAVVGLAGVGGDEAERIERRRVEERKVRAEQLMQQERKKMEGGNVVVENVVVVDGVLNGVGQRDQQGGRGLTSRLGELLSAAEEKRKEKEEEKRVEKLECEKLVRELMLEEERRVTEERRCIASQVEEMQMFLEQHRLDQERRKIVDRVVERMYVEESEKWWEAKGVERAKNDRKREELMREVWRGREEQVKEKVEKMMERKHEWSVGDVERGMLGGIVGEDRRGMDKDKYVEGLKAQVMEQVERRAMQAEREKREREKQLEHERELKRLIEFEKASR